MTSGMSNKYDIFNMGGDLSGVLKSGSVEHIRTAGLACAAGLQQYYDLSFKQKAVLY